MLYHYNFTFFFSLSILFAIFDLFKWQNFGAAAAEKFKVAKRQNSFQSDALVLLSFSNVSSYSKSCTISKCVGREF